MNARTLLVSAMLTTLAAVGTWAADTAKIERAVAEKTALARVPGGHVKEGELEHEHGRLVWSFDIEKPGSRDIVEVQVDANSGEVVSTTIETPADEAKEAAKEQPKKK